MSNDSVKAVFEKNRQRWHGCHWDTAFGPLQLQLKGLTARQAQILANATAGEESLAWHQAARWLDHVERDAQLAESEAALAVQLALAQQFDQAMHHARRACELQREYPELHVWNALFDVIQSSEVRLRNGTNPPDPGKELFSQC